MTRTEETKLRSLRTYRFGKLIHEPRFRARDTASARRWNRSNSSWKFKGFAGGCAPSISWWRIPWVHCPSVLNPIADNAHEKFISSNKYDCSLHLRMPMWADSRFDSCLPILQTLIRLNYGGHNDCAFLRQFSPTTAHKVDILLATALDLVNPTHLRNWFADCCYCIS